MRCGILGGFFLLGTAVVGDGGKLFEWRCASFVYLVSVGQYQADLAQCFSTAGTRPVPGPGINYTGPRDVLLEFFILFF